MLIFKVAKFVLKHPLLTHGARQLVHKKLRPQKEASPMKQKVRGHAFRLVGLILGIIGATVSIIYTWSDERGKQFKPPGWRHLRR